MFWWLRSPEGRGIWAHLTLFRDYLVYTQKYQMGQSQALGGPPLGHASGQSCCKVKNGGRRGKEVAPAESLGAAASWHQFLILGHSVGKCTGSFSWGGSNPAERMCLKIPGMSFLETVDCSVLPQKQQMGGGGGRER